jgi:hypothetical protein
MSRSVSTSDRRHEVSAGAAVAVRAGWTSGYLRLAVVVDGLCALVAGLAALEVRFDGGGFVPPGISVSPWCSRCCGWARWR